MLSLLWRNCFDFRSKLRMSSCINREVFHLGAGRILAEIIVAFPVVGRAYRPRRKTAAAIRAHIAEHSIDTSCTESAFIGTDTRFE